jgi:hypothetical protein
MNATLWVSRHLNLLFLHPIQNQTQKEKDSLVQSSPIITKPIAKSKRKWLFAGVYTCQYYKNQYIQRKCKEEKVTTTTSSQSSTTTRKAYEVVVAALLPSTPPNTNKQILPLPRRRQPRDPNWTL